MIAPTERLVIALFLDEPTRTKRKKSEKSFHPCRRGMHSFKFTGKVNIKWRTFVSMCIKFQPAESLKCVCVLLNAIKSKVASAFGFPFSDEMLQIKRIVDWASLRDGVWLLDGYLRMKAEADRVTIGTHAQEEDEIYCITGTDLGKCLIKFQISYFSN